MAGHGWKRVPLFDSFPLPDAFRPATPPPASTSGAWGAALADAAGRLTLLEPAGLAPVAAGVPHVGGLVAAIALEASGVGGSEGRGMAVGRHWAAESGRRGAHAAW